MPWMEKARGTLEAFTGIESIEQLVSIQADPGLLLGSSACEVGGLLKCET